MHESFTMTPWVWKHNDMSWRLLDFFNFFHKWFLSRKTRFFVRSISHWEMHDCHSFLFIISLVFFSFLSVKMMSQSTTTCRDVTRLFIDLFMVFSSFFLQEQWLNFFFHKSQSQFFSSHKYSPIFCYRFSTIFPLSLKEKCQTGIIIFLSITLPIFLFVLMSHKMCK